MATSLRCADPSNCALVLVDYQERLMPAIDRGPQVVAEATCLADVALALGLTVLGTEQNPRGLGPNVDAIRERCAITMPKMHFDACADGLLDLLRPASVHAELPDVVIAGCEAHVCLMQTSLGLLRAGHPLWVVAPACGSRSPNDHELAWASALLLMAFVLIMSLEMVVFEWLQSCTHQRFKGVLQLIKARGGAPP
jgi:nicotinamidase-related amidase